MFLATTNVFVDPVDSLDQRLPGPAIDRDHPGPHRARRRPPVGASNNLHHISTSYQHRNRPMRGGVSSQNGIDSAVDHMFKLKTGLTK
jgi:hypothetical protein